MVYNSAKEWKQKECIKKNGRFYCLHLFVIDEILGNNRNNILHKLWSITILVTLLCKKWENKNFGCCTTS